MKKTKETFCYLFYLLNIVYNTNKGKKYILLKAVMAILSPVVSLCGVVIPGLLIDELACSARYNMIVSYILILFFVPYLWNLVQNAINHYVIEVLKYDLTRTIEANFYKHIAKLDYDFFDKPHLVDLQSQAHEVIMNDVIGSVDSLCQLISTAISFLALSSLITKLNPIVIAIIIITLIINFFISKSHKGKLIQYEDETKKRRRHKWMHTYVLTSNLYAKEVRLFQMGDFLSDKVTEANQRIDELNHKLNKHSYNATWGHLSTSLFQCAFVYVYTIYSVITGSISIGYMSIINSSATQLASLLGSVSGLYL